MAYGYGPEPRRPGIVTVMTVVSFLLSIVDVGWFFITVVFATLLGVLSWLGGPVAGAAGTLIGGFILLIAIVRFFLSLLLFVAAWNSYQGRPEGRTQHRQWAWITVVLDALDLFFTGGMSPAGWWGLVYAVAVLFVTDQPEVRAYFERGWPGPPPPGKPEGVADEIV